LRHLPRVRVEQAVTDQLHLFEPEISEAVRAANGQRVAQAQRAGVIRKPTARLTGRNA
jgi:hypothetical protein